MAIIKIALIGCGHIGKRHAEMITRNEESELVALCDIQDKSKLGLEQYDQPFFNSIDDLLASEIDFDVLAIATPNGFHAEHSLKALELSKHIILEKPMALNKKDCETIIYKALQVSKQVFCVMQNRYSPPSVWIKDIIETGKLGEIYMVNINCFWNRDERYYKNKGWKGIAEIDGGTLFTQFSHFIDIMYWLFGDITNIKTSFSDFNHHNNTEFEDSGIVQFNFVNGGMGVLSYSTAVNNKNYESTLSIVGEKGTVKIGGQYMNKIEYCDIEDYVMPELSEGNPANDYGSYKGSAANHNYVYENVLDSLNRRKAPTTNALEGMKVVDIIERIYTDNKYFKTKKGIVNHQYLSK